ncbi:MAG: hypothetical protein EPN46_06380 [Candidimonas sp.]|nr:MAG: hypothetical protein EPN77_13425 [Candidimonas sp.]TAM23562.1 MAG: hypothetical protein EPN62_08990 [Candidimonas sp.]TAM77281.1 MAG: hypothetical protein EPN46_06380 [Candidimonas sp.]
MKEQFFFKYFQVRGNDSLAARRLVFIAGRLLFLWNCRADVEHAEQRILAGITVDFAMRLRSILPGDIVQASTRATQNWPEISELGQPKYRIFAVCLHPTQKISA